MSKQISVKLATYWLNEAVEPDEEIRQTHVRVRKGWLFVRYPKYVENKNYKGIWDGYGWPMIQQGWDDEVDCYRAPKPHPTDPGMVISDNIFGEAYSDVKYQNSPFIPHNHERVNKAIAKLDKEYFEDEE